MQFSALGAVALIYKDKKLALSPEIRRQTTFQFLQVVVHLFVVQIFLTTKFVYQRADEPWRITVELLNKIASAFGSVDILIHTPVNFLNLFVQFGAVGNDEHPGIVDVFAYPFGKPYHGQAFTATLGVPDNTAFSSLCMILRSFYTEILVGAAELFHAPVEHNKIMQQLHETLFVEQLDYVFVEPIIEAVGHFSDRSRNLEQIFIVGIGLFADFLPSQVIFFGSVDGSIS